MIVKVRVEGDPKWTEVATDYAAVDAFEKFCKSRPLPSTFVLHWLNGDRVYRYRCTRPFEFIDTFAHEPEAEEGGRR